MSTTLSFQPLLVIGHLVSLAIPCIFIAIQDIRERSVSLVWFVLLFIIATSIHYIEEGIHHLVKNSIYNMLFVSIQLFLLHCYFWVKERKISLLFDQKLGWGDVVFLMSPIVFFSLPYFIIFYLSSLVFTLILSLSIQKLSSNFKTIPLAGMQAIYFILYLILCIAIKASPFSVFL